MNCLTLPECHKKRGYQTKIAWNITGLNGWENATDAGHLPGKQVCHEVVHAEAVAACFEKSPSDGSCNLCSMPWVFLGVSFWLDRPGIALRGGLLITCQNYLDWLLLTRRSNSKLPSDVWSPYPTLFLSLSQDTLQIGSISATWSLYLSIYW